MKRPASPFGDFWVGEAPAEPKLKQYRTPALCLPAGRFSGDGRQGLARTTRRDADSRKVEFDSEIERG